MRSQVLFVMSVMGNSQMVLFDEPTSGLDPESRRLLWNVMLALFQQAAPDGSAAVSDGARTSTPVWRADATPRSCVLTTHSLEEAEALCSRIAILLRGQIYALGICTRYCGMQTEPSAQRRLWMIIILHSWKRFRIIITVFGCSICRLQVRYSSSRRNWAPASRLSYT